MIGRRLGHYRIEEKLGQGGMGAVYRARDEKLDRTVALKVLHESSRSDATMRRRLEREAMALSKLNHPHICIIYEIGDEGGLDYIAMEHVEGATLCSLVPAGGLAGANLQRYATQIAGALAHAHDRGIVHRDLKGSNILITPEGVVKVLDFGLARLVVTPNREATLSEPLTGTGMIAGTPPYLAPELLRGGEPDTRSDIWALGVMLYQAATGRMPFAGRTGFELAAAIMNQEPGSLPSHLSAPLATVIERCLQKDPEARYQRASEIVAALEHGEAAVERRSTAARTRSRGRVALAAAGVALAAVALFWILRRPGPPRIEGLTLLSAFDGSHQSPTFSPDGSMIAFASDAGGVSQIWVKNLAQGDPVRITSGDAPASMPSWSPKNDQIVFARRGQGIWSVPPLGGPARQLVEPGWSPSFSADGEQMVYETNDQLWIARADGGGARPIPGVRRVFYMTQFSPALSPDSRYVAYFVAALGPHGDIWIAPVAGGEPRRLTNDRRDGGGPVWTPDGRWIIYSSTRAGSRTLWRVPAAGGVPEPLTTGAGEDSSPAISRDGKRLAYNNARNNWTLEFFDPASGQRRTILDRRTEVLWPRISPDGTRVAFFHGGSHGVQVFTVSMEGGELRQITHGVEQFSTMPRWSQDGKSVYFYRPPPQAGLYSAPAASGPSRQILPWRWEQENAVDFGPDGRAVYTRQKPRATLIRDMASGREEALATPMFGARWSRDGKSIVGTIGEEIVICPAGPAACRTVAKGIRPAWSGDGRKLYFLRRGARAGDHDLWSRDLAGGTEKNIGPMGPYRAIDVFFDVSPKDTIISAPFHQGRSEVWLADIR